MEGVKLTSIFVNIIRFFVLILFIAVFVTVLGIFVTLCSPIYLLRFIVSKLSIFGPHLVKIVPPVGTGQAIDSIYTRPKCTVVLCLTLKGNSPNIVTQVRKSILDKVIGGRKENGEPTNFGAEELRQYPYKWMGFYFWRWDDTFDISNHVNFYTPPEIDGTSTVSQTQLRKIEQEIVYKAFMKNRSPWDIHIVKNVECEDGEVNSVMLFRYHHLISDGISAMKIFHTAFFDRGITSMDKFLTKPQQEKKSNQFLTFCQKLLLFPSQFKTYALEGLDKNEWIASDYSVPRKNFTVLSDKIKLLYLKEIAKSHGVGTNALVYAGLAAASRKTMLRKRGKIPKSTHIGVPIFIPGHPNKLVIYVSLVGVELPVEEPDSVKRLQRLHKNFHELKDSLVPMFLFYLVPIFGSLLPCMVSLVSKSSGFAGSSSFPGPKETVYVADQEMVDFHFLSGTFLGQCAIIYYTLTYRDGFRIVITTNSPLFENEEEVKEIVKDIQDEFSILKNNFDV